MSGSPGAILARRRKLFAEIREERDKVIAYLRAEYPEEDEFLAEAAERVRRVAVVLGSPRGGTSVFKQVLAMARGALALPGEHRLLFTLLGLNFPDHGGLDECVESGCLDDYQRSFLLYNMLYECRGEEIADPTPREWERHAWEWALRIRLQWPELKISAEELTDLIRPTLLGPRTGPEPAFRVLRALRSHGLPVDPYQYDLDEELVAAYFPGLTRHGGPPGHAIVEISPFVALRPRRRPPLRDGSDVLLLKASSDAYRIPLLHDLFKDWNLREIHLTRNPLASVNGLIDGWQHRSFYQHDLSVITDVPGLRKGWNFDLCEGWQELNYRCLAELCARQWSDPHRRILRNAARPLRLRFEDFQAGVDERKTLMDRAAVACGLRFDEWARAAVERPRPVNSTAAPALGRWLRKRPGLRGLLSSPDVADVCRLIGYDPADWRLWP